MTENCGIIFLSRRNRLNLNFNRYLLDCDFFKLFLIRRYPEYAEKMLSFLVYNYPGCGSGPGTTRLGGQLPGWMYLNNRRKKSDGRRLTVIVHVVGLIFSLPVIFSQVQRRPWSNGFPVTPWPCLLILMYPLVRFPKLHTSTLLLILPIHV